MGKSGKSVRYVALGDSYTIGEGVPPDERWPNMLVDRLRAGEVPIELVANPSVTGWTTAQLIEHELPVLESSGATFITMLIGVNDWVQGVPIDHYRENLCLALDRAGALLPDSAKILLVTIPDFSVTPEGAKYGRGRDIAAGIASFNAVIRDEGASRGLPVIDIFPLSQELVGSEYVAADGLHPSAAAYASWTDLIFPVALEMLATKASEEM